MEIQFHKSGQKVFAEIVSEEVILTSEQDALQLLADCRYQGADVIIVQEKHISPDFFELKTKLAGDILQKFSTYDGYLAIIGDFSKYQSNSLRDFIYESNKLKRIVFVANLEEAVSKFR